MDMGSPALHGVWGTWGDDPLAMRCVYVTGGALRPDAPLVSGSVDSVIVGPSCEHPDLGPGSVLTCPDCYYNLL